MAGPKRAEVRVYSTVNGEFVGEGDPRGAFLVLGVGADVPEAQQGLYDRFMKNRPQDAADSDSAAAKAYTDEDTRDLLRQRQAGDVSARAALGEAPILIHDRLATELADEARVLANAPAADVAEFRNDSDNEGVYATHRVWRTADGDLVHEGDENAATLAYAEGARIDDGDVDEFNDLGDPPKDETPDETKAAPKPANKSVRKTADK